LKLSLLTGSLTVCLFTSFAGTSIAQSTATGVEAAPSYDSLQPPATGGTYVDPVFGATIKRVSNALSTPDADRGGMLTSIMNEYSTASAFNGDNSKLILLHQSYFGLYDGSGTFLGNLPLEISASSEPRWSRKDNATLYYHAGNMLKSYNVASGATAVVHTFSEYSSINGNGEMDISLDGDHFVFAGDSRYIFVYEISTDKKYGVFDTGSTRFDSLYITPQNNVIVSWYPSGTVRFTGQELFDINMNFLRQVGRADGHKHLTRDNDGSEVLVWTNSADPQPIANCQNGIVKIRLADATETCLAQLDWSLAVHITAPDGNGSVFVETYAPSNPEPGTSGWVAYTNELLQVKLNGSGVTRIAQHRSRPWNSYTYEPKMTASRDGSRLLYASNFDLQKIDGYAPEYSDTYMIVLGGPQISSGPVSTPVSAPVSAPVSNPPAPVTASTVRYEQDNPAIQYSGTWFPNGGAFNSAGTAAMAMDSGSKATLTFTGTAVKWIGFSDPWSGVGQVYLDGALVSTVDTYSPTQTAQAVQYSAANLSNTTHTLAIVASGNHSSQSAGAWVWVDAFDVTGTPVSTPVSTPPAAAPAPVTLSTVRYEQDNPAIQYNGSWFPNGGAFNSGGTATMAMDSGSNATLTFTGTAVRWIGFSDPWSGIAQVYLDGALAGTVDTYSPTQTAQAVQYSVANLSNTTHTIAIVATATHSSQSAGAWVWVDAFEVTGTGGQSSSSTKPAPHTVANAAGGGTDVAPGSLISIYGSQMGSTAVAAAATPLPVQLNNVSATVNGVSIPLFYVSAGQINAQLPYNLAAGNASLTVTANGVDSDPLPFTVAATAPELFRQSGSRALAINADQTTNGPDSPAKAGSVIVAYLTGQAAVDNPVASGAAAIAAPLAKPLAPVTAALDGQPITVLAAALAPDLVGVSQANLQLPDVAAGDHSLTIQVGEAVSQPVTITIQ
jgi:uncharacterized protein (TIGR03437 family)